MSQERILEKKICLWALVSGSIESLLIPFNLLTSFMSVEGCKRITDGRKETEIPFNPKFCLFLFINDHSLGEEI